MLVLFYQDCGGPFQVSPPNFYNNQSGLWLPPNPTPTTDPEVLPGVTPTSTPSPTPTGTTAPPTATPTPTFVPPLSVGFSTYLGGSATDFHRDVAIDSQGDVIVVGVSSSTNYPTTAGAHSRTMQVGGASLGNAGPMDAVITKIRSNGQVVWSTYFGGPNYDRIYAVEVDSSDNIYVAGRAGDLLPTTPGAFQTAFGGDNDINLEYGRQDGFIAKFSPTGALIWATYVGGPDRAFIRDIAVDSARNVYAILPNVTSNHSYITANAFQPHRGGANDMMLVKLSADGKNVLYASYYGGSGDDGGGPSIKLDSAGNIFVLGVTNSLNLPVSAHAYQKTNAGGADFALAKIAPSGSLVFSTYFGGSGNEDCETHNLALDSSGNAFISGETNSTNLPVTAGAFMNHAGGSFDSSVSKISSDGSRLLASTYVGGSGIDHSQGIEVDAIGNVYLSMTTGSLNFLVTANALYPRFSTFNEWAFVKLSADLQKLLYATAIPANGNLEQARCIAVRGSTVVVGGMTNATDFPVIKAYQSAPGGGLDGAVVELLGIP
jgi:hypothetical protein